MDVVLGIETSCDETAAGVLAGGKDVLSNVVASQNDLHAKFRALVYQSIVGPPTGVPAGRR